MVFIINFLLLLLEAFLCRTFKKEKLFLFLAFLQMGCLLAFRGIGVGIDTATYYSEVEYIGNGNGTCGFEVGDVFLIRLLYILTGSAQGIIVGYAFITLLIAFYVLRKTSDDIYLSVILYSGMLHYNFSFNGMRQALAISVIMLAMMFLLNGHRLKAILATLAAFLFHESAIIFLVLILLDYLKITKTKNLGLLAALTFIVLFAFSEGIITFGANMAGYASYLSIEKYTNFRISYNVFFYLLVFIICLRRDKGANQRDTYKNGIMTFSLMIAVGFYILAFNLSQANRIALYFSAPIYVLIPNIISREKTNVNPKRCLAISLAAAYLIVLMLANSNGVLPYTFFWE